MNVVRPVRIVSPISGEMCAPRIVERQEGKNTIVEAHWIDPRTNLFIRKGVVEVKPTKK